MMLDEKRQLLELLDQPSKWCQHVEARDAQANPVHCDDRAASAWDVTGAIYRLFAPERAATLCVQVDRHIHGKKRAFRWPPPDTELDALVALQEFNDREDTTFEVVRTRLESMPIWSGDNRPSASLPGKAAEEY